MMHTSCGRLAASLMLLFPAAAGAANPPESDVLRIADLDHGKIESVAGLAPVPIADDQMGGASETRFALVQPGAQGSPGALRISFQTADGFPYPFAGAWVLLGAEGLPADLSAYRGMRFYARSTGGSFQAGVTQVSGRLMRYMATFETKPDWTLVEVPFDKLQQSPPTGKPAPLVPKDVTSVGFAVSSRLRGQFDLEIDQLELYK